MPALLEGVGRDAFPCRGPGLRPGVNRPDPRASRCACTLVVSTAQAVAIQLFIRSALTLLVPRIVADHHDTTVAADHLALVTDPLDTGTDLHGATFMVGAEPPTDVDVPSLVQG